jgi:hypothetical protein
MRSENQKLFGAFGIADELNKNVGRKCVGSLQPTSANHIIN